LPCGSSCVTARDASDRLLPSHVFVRAPAPRGFPTSVTGSTLVLVGGPSGSRQRGSLRRTAPSVSLFMRGALSSPRHVCGRASDTPVAPSAKALCAHALVAVAVAAEADPTGRVKRYLRESGPRCLPFDKDPCPAMPFRAPWLEPSPEARFGHRDPGLSTPFHQRGLSDPLVRLSFTRPVATGSALLSSLGDACRLSATLDTTRGHTRASCPILARELPAPTDAGCVGLRCVSAPRPASRELARSKSRAEALERRRGAFRERFRTCPPRGASGTLGRRCDCSRGWISPCPFAPAEIRTPMAPRERRHRSMDRGAFCHGEILTRPSSIAARARPDRHHVTPPPWRHCSGVRAPLVTASPPPASDEESGNGGSTRRAREAEAPADRRVAAPVMASTTESARGLMCRELHDLSFSESAFRATRK